MAGRLRRPADVLLRARPVERRGPDPQGADVRPRRRRRQPRRGRQGVLVVPGLHAHPLVDALALPLPAGRVPVRRPGRGQRAAAAGTSRSTSWSTPAIFDDDRYWAVTVDYAKASPTDLCVLVTVANRGPEAATLHVLPTLWFRNTWSWGLPGRDRAAGAARRRRPAGRPSTGYSASWCWPATASPTPLLCDNETNTERLWGLAGRSRVPQGRDQRPRGGRRRHGQPGRRAAPRARCTTCWTCRPAGRRQIRLRLARTAPPTGRRAARRRWTSATASTRCWRPGGPRRTRSSPASSRPARRAGRGDRRPAGDRRADVGQAVLPLRREPVAARRPGVGAAAGRPPARAATAPGGT